MTTLSAFHAAICTLVLATAGCGTLAAGPARPDAPARGMRAEHRVSARPVRVEPLPVGPARFSDVEVVEPGFQQNLARGAVLDVWLNNRDGDLATLTGERSLGTTVVQGDYFRYNKVNADPDLRSYWGQPLLLKWSALLEITERGPHVFVSELSKEKGVRPFSARTLVKLNGETLFEREAQEHAYPISVVESKVVSLERGFHRLEVWLAADFNRAPASTTQLGTYVKMRAPSDRTPQLLPSSRIWHRAR
ncbi:MAG TPA: hypothetical protein VFR81_14430 [Longimicrobium sp.]|nr:hypothetical protein [Longimicrobium sp.]